MQGECVECVPSDSAATCSGTKTCIDGRLVPALQVEGSARTLSNDITAQLLIVILVFIILLLIIVIANSCRGTCFSLDCFVLTPSHPLVCLFSPSYSCHCGRRALWPRKAC